MKHTLEDILKELRHEVYMRETVYPKRVEMRKMTRQAADKKTALMREAAEIIENLLKNQPKQARLF